VQVKQHKQPCFGGATFFTLGGKIETQSQDIESYLVSFKSILEDVNKADKKEV